MASHEQMLFAASLEPAYVDVCAPEGFGRMCESHLLVDESGRIAFKPMDAISQATQASGADDLYNSGKSLKTALSFFHLPYPPGPYGNNLQLAQSSDWLPQGSCGRQDRKPALSLIATHLNELESDDPDKVIIVRKMNRLGLKSSAILKQHFSRFGVVEKLRLANTHDQKLASSLNARLRPSGIAFVVFESSVSASQVLAEGETQNVHGVQVSVSRFERRRRGRNHAGHLTVGSLAVRP